jgi:hypothetical protein
VWQHTTHPLGDVNDARTGVTSSLCFPYAVYNMVTTACHLEDISNTPNLKTNEWLNEVKRLLRIALEQHSKSSASRHHVVLS